MFTPTAKEECSKSLARVMEIQRQVSIMHHTSYALWRIVKDNKTTTFVILESPLCLCSLSIWILTIQAALGHINATNTLSRTDNYPGLMQYQPAGNLGKQWTLLKCSKYTGEHVGNEEQKRNIQWINYNWLPLKWFLSKLKFKEMHKKLRKSYYLVWIDWKWI